MLWRDLSVCQHKKLHLLGQTITRSPKFCKSLQDYRKIKKSKAVRLIFSRFSFRVVQALFDHYPVRFKLIFFFLLMLAWSRDGGQITNKMLWWLTCIKMQNLSVVWSGSLKLCSMINATGVCTLPSVFVILMDFQGCVRVETMINFSESYIYMFPFFNANWLYDCSSYWISYFSVLTKDLLDHFYLLFMNKCLGCF